MLKPDIMMLHKLSQAPFSVPINEAQVSTCSGRHLAAEGTVVAKVPEH